MLYKELNIVNDNDSYWLWWLIYLSMIDEHIISIEFGFNSFNATCGFNTKVRSLKAKYLWIKMFKMNDVMVKKTQGKQQVA
jgi:hypothetical protein